MFSNRVNSSQQFSLWCPVWLLLGSVAHQCQTLNKYYVVKEKSACWWDFWSSHFVFYTGKKKVLSSWCYTTLEKNDLSCSCFINLEVNVVDGKNNWAFIWSSLSAELHQLPDRPSCPMECKFANIIWWKNLCYAGKLLFFSLWPKAEDLQLELQLQSKCSKTVVLKISSEEWL